MPHSTFTLSFFVSVKKAKPPISHARVCALRGDGRGGVKPRIGASALAESTSPMQKLDSLEARNGWSANPVKQLFLGACCLDVRTLTFLPTNGV